MSHLLHATSHYLGLLTCKMLGQVDETLLAKVVEIVEKTPATDPASACTKVVDTLFTSHRAVFEEFFKRTFSGKTVYVVADPLLDLERRTLILLMMRVYVIVALVKLGRATMEQFVLKWEPATPWMIRHHAHNYLVCYLVPHYLDQVGEKQGLAFAESHEGFEEITREIEDAEVLDKKTFEERYVVSDKVFE